MAEREIKYKVVLDGAELTAEQVSDITKAVTTLGKTFQTLDAKTFNGIVNGVTKLNANLTKTTQLARELANPAKVEAPKPRRVSRVSEDEAKLDSWTRKLNQQIQLGKFPMLPTPEQQRKQMLTSIGLGAGLAPFSSFLAARSFSNAVGGGADGGKGGGNGGIFGTGGGKFFNEFYIAIEALKKAIQFVATHIKEAFDYGARLFIQSNKLGQNAGHLFGVRQGGEAVGLTSEEMDKFLLRVGHGAGKGGAGQQQFGDMLQLGSLKETFKEVVADAELAADTMHRTAGEFYSVHVAGVMAETTMKEFWALLAEGSSGVMVAFLTDMKEFFMVLNQSGTTAALGKELGAVLLIVEKAFGLVSIAVSGFVLGLQVLAAAFNSVIIFINNLIAKIPGAGKVGFTPMEHKDVWKDVVKGATALHNQAEAWGKNWSLTAKEVKNDREGKPPFAWQIPRMGNWEKMGLSFGSGGMVSDFARQTAENTRKLVEMAAKQVQHHVNPTHRSLVTNAP